MKRSIRPRFNAEDDEEDLEQLQREFFEKNTVSSAKVVRGAPPVSTTPTNTKKKQSLFAQRRQQEAASSTDKTTSKKSVTIQDVHEDQAALASMPALENVADMPTLDNGDDMPQLEGVVDPNQEHQPHVPVSKKMLDLTSLLGNILSDVTENKVEKVEAPSLKIGTERSQQHEKGFPKPAKRSLFKMRMAAKNNNNSNNSAEPPKATTGSLSSSQPTKDYEQENLDRIDQMTEAEIEAARQEIMSSLSSDSIALLMNRGNKTKDPEEGQDDDLMVMKERYFADVPTEYEKLAWMDSRFDTTPKTPADDQEETSPEDQMYRRIRFDFQGKPIDPNADVPVHQGLHHHGDEPDKAGYTLAELFYLVRSQVAPQRVMVLNTLTRILRNAKQNRGDHFWDQVWALFLRPDVAAVAYLRSAIDDRHLVVLVAAIQTMAALVLEKGDDLDLENMLDVEQFVEFLGYIAQPIIKDEKTMAGLEQKFTTTVNRLQGKEEDEEDEILEDDVYVAQRDLTQGLIRMNILQRIRYLMLPNSELDAKSIELLVRILIRLAKSGATVCESIMEHDLLDHTLTWGIQKREWPMTNTKEEYYPSLATLRLLTVLAQGSRRVAEQINQKANILQFLVTPVQVHPSLQKRAYAMQVETIKLLRVLVAYGLVMPQFVDLHEPMMSWLRAGLGENELDVLRATITISLLEISLHAAADPHKTTPPHAIDWHQPTAFIPVILAILRTKEGMIFDCAVGYFAILTSYMDRFPRVDDTISATDIWKVVKEKKVSVIQTKSNSILRYVQLLCAFASAKTFPLSDQAYELLASQNVSDLIQKVYNQNFLGRLAMITWMIHVKDRPLRIKLWHQTDYDAAELESTVTSMQKVVERQLGRKLVQLCILDRLSKKLASTLALFYLQDNIQDYPLLLDHDGTRLNTLVYPERMKQADNPSSVTAYIFSPIDEMYHMDSLAQKCRDSSAHVIAATLEAATVFSAHMDHAIVFVSIMKIFMISEAIVGENNDQEKEIFWDDRITYYIKYWLDLIFKHNEIGSLASAWRRSCSSASIRMPFYQFYQQFVAQYASVSFGHEQFASVLSYILIHQDEQDYKYLVWSDYRDILSTLKTAALPKVHASKHSTALLRAYMSALAENKVEGALREFAVNELKFAMHQQDVPDHLKRDISNLLS